MAMSRTPTPTLPSPIEYPSDVGIDVLCNWREAAAYIVMNRPVGDSQILAALGDLLRANGGLSAAHTWSVLNFIHLSRSLNCLSAATSCLPLRHCCKMEDCQPGDTLFWGLLIHS